MINLEQLPQGPERTMIERLKQNHGRIEAALKQLDKSITFAMFRPDTGGNPETFGWIEFESMRLDKASYRHALSGKVMLQSRFDLDDTVRDKELGFLVIVSTAVQAMTDAMQPRINVGLPQLAVVSEEGIIGATITFSEEA